MADAVLSVAITADIDALRDSFNKAVRETSGFDKDTRTALAAVDKGFADLANKIDGSINKAASSTKKASNDISKSLAQSASIAATSGQAIAGGSNKAAFALTNLGRVAQDAPFGFIGIQNNLNPLLESFQSLRKEAGSNVGALKALGQSLIGPAGIGIALSVVGAAILFFQQYQQKAKKNTQELTDANKEYVDSLSGFDQAILKGTENGVKATQSLQQLYKVTQDNTFSVQERTKAAKILQDTYPATFKNFSTEQILLGNSQTAYENLTKSIIAQAVVKAASDKVAENSIKKLEVEGRIRQKQVELTEQQIKSEKEKADASRQTGTNAGGFAGANTGNVVAAIKANDEANKAKDIEREIGNIRIERFKLDKENLQLNEFITDEIKKQGVAVLGLDKNLEKVKKTTESTKSQIERVKPIKEDVLLDTFRQYNTKPFELGVKIKPILDVTGFLTESEKELALLSINLGKDLSDLVQKSIGESIGSGFTAIGEAIANGGNPIQAFGNSILSSFGSFLSQFGTLLIQYGIAATAFGKLQASLLVPGAAVISGPLAIAAGLALKIASGAISGLVSGKSSGSGSGYQIPQFATGVTNFGGGLALVGERGPELVNLPTGSNVITNQNTNKLIGSNRGSSSVIIPDVKISGQDLVLVFNRASKFNSRR